MTMTKQQYYGSSLWKKIRTWYENNEPECRLCRMRGIHKHFDDIHHIVKFYEQYDDNQRNMLFQDKDNLIPLCEDCHHHVHTKKGQNWLDPNQKQYLYDYKNYIMQKYLSNGICLRWTKDTR